MKNKIKKLTSLVMGLVISFSLVPLQGVQAATVPYGFTYTFNEEESSTNTWVVDVDFGVIPYYPGACTYLLNASTYEISNNGVHFAYASSVTNISCNETDYSEDMVRVTFADPSLVCDSGAYTMTTASDVEQTDSISGLCSDGGLSTTTASLGSDFSDLYAYSYADDLNTVYVHVGGTMEPSAVDYCDNDIQYGDTMYLPYSHDRSDNYPVSSYVKGVNVEGCHTVGPGEDYEPDVLVLVYDFNLETDPPVVGDTIDFGSMDVMVWFFESMEDGGVKFTDELNGVLVNTLTNYDPSAYFFYRTFPTEEVPTDEFGYGYGYGKSVLNDWGLGYGFGYGYDYFAQSYAGWMSDGYYSGFGVGTGSSEGEFALPVTDGEGTIPFPLDLEGYGFIAGATVHLPSGLTLKGDGWDGTINVTTSTDVPESMSGYFSAVAVVTVDTGGVALGLSAPVVVTIPYPDFDAIVSKLVMMVDGAGSYYSLSECTGEYIGSVTNSVQLADTAYYDMPENTLRDNSEQCYLYYDGIVYVATNHFTEFVAGETIEDNGGGGGGGGNDNNDNDNPADSPANTPVDDNNTDILTTVYTELELDVPVIPEVIPAEGPSLDDIPVDEVLPEEVAAVDEILPEEEDAYDVNDLLELIGITDTGEGDAANLEAIIAALDASDGENAGALEDFDLNLIDSREMYTNSDYERVALTLLANYSKDCAGDNSMECLKTVYGLIDLENEAMAQGGENLSDMEVGDAIVFQKLPGEVITTPRITNLGGTIGSTPEILVLSQPNDHVHVDISSESVDIATIGGDTDEGGKLILVPKKPLPDGKYIAKVHAVRNGEVVLGNGKSFTVDKKVDDDFYVSDLKVEEQALENELKKDGIVREILSYVEQFAPEFNAEKYIAYVREQSRTFIVTGKINQSEENKDNAMVYLTYKSVILGSAVIADASQGGTFKQVISKELPKDLHALNTYAYNPKKNVSTSMNKISFNTK